MGEFLAASAFRTQNADALCAAIAQFFSEHGYPAQRVEPGDPRDGSGNDAAVYEPAGAWCVVTWPTYMQDGPAVEAITTMLGTTASSIRVHDGDYWVHRLVENGRTLDRFASMPDYFAADPHSPETARLAAEWAGHPGVLATALGAAESDIAPYLLQAPALDDEDEDADHFEEPGGSWGKAFADDEHDRANVWVFVDFWRRIGITYPAASDGRSMPPKHLLRLPAGAALKLPQGSDVL